MTRLKETERRKRNLGNERNVRVSMGLCGLVGIDVIFRLKS